MAGTMIFLKHLISNSIHSSKVWKVSDVTKCSPPWLVNLTGELFATVIDLQIKFKFNSFSVFKNQKSFESFKIWRLLLKSNSYVIINWLQFRIFSKKCEFRYFHFSFLFNFFFNMFSSGICDVGLVFTLVGVCACRWFVVWVCLWVMSEEFVYWQTETGSLKDRSQDKFSTAECVQKELLIVQLLFSWKKLKSRAMNKRSKTENSKLQLLLET